MPIRVCFPFVGDSVGGSHIATTLLIRHLDPALVEPVVVLHESGPLASYLKQNGVPFEFLAVKRLAGAVPSISNIAFAQISALPRLAGFLHRNQIDVVHTNDLRTHLTWAPATRIRSAKFVWHQHVLLSPSRAWFWLAMAADQAICVSEAVARTMPPRVPRHVVMNPIDLSGAGGQDDRKSELLETLGLAPATKLVGFVGNMTRQKRPHVFVHAAAHIAEATGQEVAFLMFGDDRGGQKAESERLAAEIGIAEKIHFLGHKSPIEPWLKALDLLLAPGVGDGFGRSLIEAMVSGIPVVAAKSGGHPEIITDGKTGLLVPADDPKAMAKAALRVLTDRELSARLQAGARTHAASAYDPGTIAGQISAIYSLALE